MKLYEITEDAKVPQKPRQGPLRPQTGAGRHQDKKKAMKQGKEKHKKPFSESFNTDIEIELHQLTKSPDIFDAIYDSLTRGDKLGMYLQDMYDDIARESRLHPDDDFEDIISRMADQIESSYGNPDIEEVRNDNFRNRERNVGVEHERNNYQVTINGRPWKVFADQQQAMNIARSLRMKGKEVEVYPTGANPSESVAEAAKKRNATTRHLRDYPVSDKDVAKPVKKPEKKKPEQGVAEGVGGWSGPLYDPALQGNGKKQRYEMMFKNGQVKRFSAMNDNEARKIAAGHGAKSVIKMKGNVPGDKIGEQGVAEGSSYQTDSMVSHISQIITDIYPQGGDKNTYMKLVAQKMPSIVKADPELFRRAFGIAYDRFFHIGQDDDDDDNFDYTDYSMRQGERGMEEGVAGPKQCWPGHRKVGTQPGTGKNAGKRVNDCEKIKKEDYINLENLDDFNNYLELLDHMIKK